MRNGMDHLTDKINNFASMKRNHDPIFGSISFAVWDKGEGPIPKKGRVCTLVSGTTISNGESDALVPILNPGSKTTIEFPIGNFEFSAFGRLLDISEFCRDIVSLQTALNEKLAANIREQLLAQADKLGVDPDSVLGRAGGGWSIVTLFELT
jgi:hypothetical protein